MGTVYRKEGNIFGKERGMSDETKLDVMIELLREILAELKKVTENTKGGYA